MPAVMSSEVHSSIQTPEHSNTSIVSSQQAMIQIGAVIQQSTLKQVNAVSLAIVYSETSYYNDQLDES